MNSYGLDKDWGGIGEYALQLAAENSVRKPELKTKTVVPAIKNTHTKIEMFAIRLARGLYAAEAIGDDGEPYYSEVHGANNADIFMSTLEALKFMREHSCAGDVVRVR